MLNPLIRTLVKVVVASLIVGTILSHFGITADRLVKDFGLSFERIEDMARRGLSWAAPNLLVGAMVILPVWFLLYLFSPPLPANKIAELLRSHGRSSKVA